MIKPEDFYFSTPMFSLDEDYKGKPIIVITTKKVYDTTGGWDDGSIEYREMIKTLLPKLLVEYAESVFASKKKISCNNLEKILHEIGFIYNSQLDSALKDFLGIIDKED